ncbi:MAG TPA: serine/threonine-protein kinase [bacterium]|nr:serine/threonine-protein kinase [bacterium]HPN45834.1 serine/threonine-protein kinase [bacterium]
MIEQQEKILFDKFEILQCIKKDLTSCVYIANHIYLGKKIFLKTLAKDKISDEAILHRFQREARSLAAINHPNIIQVYDFGNFKDYFYISFEYFPSSDLRSIILEKKISVQDKLAIFSQIVQGLAEAHQHNIIHRDIKPENILVNAQHQVKIADFGLALIKDDINQTRQDSIVGTPGYMSPEQIMGDDLTPASDLFSLGIAGYELFTGNNPFLGKDAGATINNILACDVVTSLDAETGIPAQVRDIFKLLLHKNKSKRPVSAQDLLPRFNIGDNHTTAVPAKASVQRKSGKYYFAFILPVLLLFVIIIVFTQTKDINKHDDQTVIIQDSTRTSADSQRTITVADYNNTIENDNKLTAGLKTKSPVPEPAPGSMPNNNQLLPDLPGKLFIQCLPWADVFIDDEKIETTPVDEHINIEAGFHELVLQHPDYPPVSRKLTVKPGEVITVSVNLDTLVGYLLCRVYPWGNVYVDNNFIGQTPLQRPVCLLTGRHVLTLKNDNFGKFDDYITIAKMETLKYKFNFERLIKPDDSVKP